MFSFTERVSRINCSVINGVTVIESLFMSVIVLD